MRLQIWPAALEQHLLETYQYDPILGVVTRKHWGGPGPKNPGPLGSLSPQGEFLINVNREGKQWAIRLTKLSVFLQTGKQYFKIAVKDGDKKNLKWDNLVPIGDPLTTQQEYDEKKKVTLEEAHRLHWERKLALELAMDKQMEKRQAEKVQLAAMSSKRQEKEKSKAEQLLAKEKEDAELMELAKRNYGMDDIVPNQFTKEDEEKKALILHYHEENQKEIWKKGITSNMQIWDAQEFLALCDKYSGTVESIEQLRARSTLLDNPETKAGLAKWEADRLWVACMLHWLDEYKEVGVRSLLAGYTWEGERVEGMWGEMLPHIKAKMEESLARLASRHAKEKAEREALERAPTGLGQPAYSYSETSQPAGSAEPTI